MRGDPRLELAAHPRIVEAHHVTGADCCTVEVLARSVLDLERIIGRLAGLGGTTAHVVCSSPVPGRHLQPARP